MTIACLILITAPAVLVLGFHVIVYSVRLYVSDPSPDDDTDRAAPLPHLVRCTAAFLAECVALTVALVSSLVRCRLRAGDEPPSRRPVILLHGYSLGPGSVRWMARRLRRDGWTWVWCVSHRSMYGDIRRNATNLAEAVERLRDLAGVDSVDIVAHSMGGLVARAYLQQEGSRTVHRLITLGTPHRGTILGGLCSIDPMVRQMRVGSAFLSDLERDESGARDGRTTEMVSIYSLFDAIVVPARNAYHSQALNIAIEGTGHTAMLLSSHVYRLIRENLDADDFLIGEPDV